MSKAERSVAMTEEVEGAARHHLLRHDGQEDLCFALWHPSNGRTRQTALIKRLVLPAPSDRNVHGNVSFQPAYFERALARAAAEGAGLALLHSHPMGHGWQGMSPDDVNAEQGNAGAVFGVTNRPFIGLTLAGNGSWSARSWERVAPRKYDRKWCATVRVLGSRMKVHYFDHLAQIPRPTAEQVRTISAWGDECQADLARLRVGLVGAGSVGGVIAEALARTGFEDVIALDFDIIEEHNLDRLQYATRADIGRPKVEVLAEHLTARATASPFNIETLRSAIYEEEGFRLALDCDVLLSCVDRPWGRYVQNLIAYAHLIPVFDGGIAVRTNRSRKLVAADWRAHTATPTRPCLQCLGQYDPADVQLEREGFLDDPKYISGLPKDHPLRTRENVYGFAMACGSNQFLQMLAYALAPLDLANPGAQLYHFVGSTLDTSPLKLCKPTCAFPGLIALGDDCGVVAIGDAPPSRLQAVKTDRAATRTNTRPRWLAALLRLIGK